MMKRLAFLLLLLAVPTLALGEPADIGGWVTLNIPVSGSTMMKSKAKSVEGDDTVTHVWVEVAGYHLLNLSLQTAPDIWYGEKPNVLFDDQTAVVLWAKDALNETKSRQLSCTTEYFQSGRIKITCTGGPQP